MFLLTTDRHEASRDLFATVELHVEIIGWSLVGSIQ